MSLLRIKFFPNVNAWDEAAPDFQQIREKWFDDKPDEQASLYEATTAREEIEAVAAFSLTNLGRGIQAGYLVRIEWDDLNAVGIRSSNLRPGNTGVVAVDFRHWEIPGDRGPILELLRHIWSRALLGEDRFRWVGKQMQVAAMNRFLNAGTHLVVEEAKRCCRRKLDNRPGGGRPLGPAIRDELRAPPPAIPEGQIKVLAGEKWLDRLSTGRAGDAVHDWLRAEHELRQLYEQELLGYTQPRAPTMPP